MGLGLLGVPGFINPEFVHLMGMPGEGGGWEFYHGVSWHCQRKQRSGQHAREKKKKKKERRHDNAPSSLKTKKPSTPCCDIKPFINTSMSGMPPSTFSGP